MNQYHCVFCSICDSVPAYTPTPSSQAQYPPSFETHNIILSTSTYLAFLDFQPLVSSIYHVLLIPRRHVVRLSELVDLLEERTQLGGILALLSRALCECFDDVEDFNIVQNNGPAAGQIVPHAHFHVIARSSSLNTQEIQTIEPDNTQERLRFQLLIYGKGPRQDLDGDAATKVCHRLRSYMYKHLPKVLSKL
ncbi:HIT-like domain-containing protein [Lipomyces arxii]|uniref:HIT-like domain-containing protein n=1 Tax=Lipomyces arxii TaxID=56418 RepID=UPI0034CFF05A